MAKRSKAAQASNLRIIGGHLRGRKFSIAGDFEGLRPTGDRIRETLFNWLQGSVAGAHCLDLFAGSGALAIEALSRGAQKVIAFDNNKQVIKHLQHIKGEWQLGPEFVIEQQDALQWLENEAQLEATLVFVDPPFALQAQQQILDLICAKPSKQNQLIYIEAVKDQDISCPANAELLKHKTAAAVQYQLYLRYADH